jgi:hypothetical protein
MSVLSPSKVLIGVGFAYVYSQGVSVRVCCACFVLCNSQKNNDLAAADRG